MNKCAQCNNKCGNCSQPQLIKTSIKYQNKLSNKISSKLKKNLLKYKAIAGMKINSTLKEIIILYDDIMISEQEIKKIINNNTEIKPVSDQKKEINIS